MDITKGVIRKVNDKFCIFSKNNKRLGCYNSRQEAEERLRQIEFFKNKGRSMSYEKVFDNFSKAFISGESTPREVDIGSDSFINGLKVGTIASFPSERVLDKKEHFPIITQTQAQSSMARVMQLQDVPVWYNGSLSTLRKEVYAGIMKLHSDIQLNIRVPAELAVGLSDGMEPSETKIDDPNDDLNKNEVPQVPRPTITSAEVNKILSDNQYRKTFANNLLDMIDKQLEHMSDAKKLAQKLFKNGLSAEEFDQLSVFLQEDVLRTLMSKNASARREQLISKLKQNEPQKPTDDDEKKKKKKPY